MPKYHENVRHNFDLLLHALPLRRCNITKGANLFPTTQDPIQIARREKTGSI